MSVKYFVAFCQLARPGLNEGKGSLIFTDEQDLSPEDLHRYLIQSLAAKIQVKTDDIVITALNKI